MSAVLRVLAIPLAGERDSQLPLVVLTLAVKAVAEAAETSIDWLCGIPPAAALKLSDVGLATIAVALSTVNKTGTTNGKPPAPVGVRMMSAR